MSESTDFEKYTEATAPEGSREQLVSAVQRFGFLPEPLARMAESPEIVDAFMAANGIFSKTSLSPIEREVLVMRVATRHGCEYCVAMHTALLKKTGAEADVIEALRTRAPLASPRLQAMARFVDELQEAHGGVSDEALAAFLAAGYTRKQALEAVLGVAVYTMSTYANRLTRAPLDAAFEPFRWETSRAAE